MKKYYHFLILGIALFMNCFGLFKLNATKSIIVNYKTYLDSPDTYTITYYLGNATSTEGVTKIGESTCTYNENCTLDDFSNTFPNSSSGWRFYGWATNINELERKYTDKQTFTYDKNENLDLYAIGIRDIKFASGISPTSIMKTIVQYWNPSSTQNISAVMIPKPIEIGNNWTFLGYRANNIASSNTFINNSRVDTEYKIGFDKSVVFRSIYQRDLTINYNNNGCEGVTPESSVQKQYYNSGFPNSSGTNSGANVALDESGFVLPTLNVSNPNYILAGWNANSMANTGTAVNTKYTDFNPKVTDNNTQTTLYAIYRLIGQYGTYQDAQNIIKEVMKSYYIRGPYMQYNYSKVRYGKDSPEEATSQEIVYAVCAAYTYDVYSEAFGMNSTYAFPIYNTSISSKAAAYYQDETIAKDGHLLIYYENTTAANKAKYIYNDAENFEDFVEIIRPGDLFVYSGHALIAYDVVEHDGKKDVLILNSTQGSYIYTRATGTSKLSYSIFKNRSLNNVLDIDAEGTIKWKWLSEIGYFVSDGKINCKKAECGVVRPFYEDENHNAVFNYSFVKKKYDKSYLRTQYPGLFIEKTVNLADNNSVNLGDELTYTIKVTNKSNSNYNSKSYGSFYIEENVDNLLEYVSTTNNGKYDAKNKSIKWIINSLDVGETIELSYKTKVKNDITAIGKTITANGKFYKDDSTYIETGTVKNIIIGRAFELKSSYQECYNINSTNYNGLNLINEIYKCASNKNFHFNNFNFENFFAKKNNPTSKGTENVIYIKSNLDDDYKLFNKMILNNYWSGLATYVNSEASNDDGDDGSEENNLSSIYLNLPRWGGEKASARNRSINSIDFKDGDILIYYIDNETVYGTSDSNKHYTAENGIYAYIYLNGKFIGKNYPGGVTERNEFTYNYYFENNYYSDKNLKNYFYSSYSTNIDAETLKYINYQTLFDKDYYVILRPSKILTDTAFNTLSYKQNDTKRIIYDIGSNSNAQVLTNDISVAGTISIIDKDNKTINNDAILKTGYTMRLIFGAEKDSPLDYKISVKGDTLGTGQFNKESAKNIIKHIIDKNVFTEGDEYFLAADYDEDSLVEMNDVVKLIKDTK